MEKIRINKEIEQLLNHIPEKKQELEEILTYGEKIREEGEKMEKEFRKNHDREDFLKILQGMYERMKEYGVLLSKMSGLQRKKFVKEYLYKKIIYSGSVDCESKREEKKLEYDKTVEFDEWVKKVKDQFEPGMTINLMGIELGDDGVEQLAKEWKYSLEPGMTINLVDIGLGADGVEKLAREWKNSLCLGMEINLARNHIGDDGVEKLAKEWKDSLKPRMIINLRDNNIGDDGAQAIKDNMQLKQGVTLDLCWNSISYMEKKLREWEFDFLYRGIDCLVYCND